MTVNVLFAAVTTQLTNMLSAIGRIKTVSKLIAMWAILTIILVPGLGYLYGVNGAALGYALVSSTSIIAIGIATSMIDIVNIRIKAIAIIVFFFGICIFFFLL